MIVTLYTPNFYIHNLGPKSMWDLELLILPNVLPRVHLLKRRRIVDL